MTDDSTAAWSARITTHAESETLAAGRLLGGLARIGDVVALAGGLGSGKTCLVKGIALGLGIREPVPSPTFNLLLVHAGTMPLYHFDLYRLERASELEDIDFFETAEAGSGLTAIEWADRFPGSMPLDRLEITLEAGPPAVRELTIEATGPRSRRLGETWLESWSDPRATGGRA
jgi:tRNA threonylcarbamoyladenosine biosynthesis protein TsaE